MTEAEKLQHGRDLIATHIMGWVLRKYQTNFKWKEGYWCEKTKKQFGSNRWWKPHLDPAQSLAVKRKLLDLGWEPRVQSTRGNPNISHCILDKPYRVSPEFLFYESDKDELMAIFKACVKAGGFGIIRR